jgi:DNA-binding beta-propeller fold protein YncE
MRFILRSAVFFLALAFPVASLPQGAATTPLARLQAAVAKDPSNSALLFFLAREQARAGDAKAAAASLTKLGEIADGYLPPPSDGFEKVWNDPQFAAAVAALDKKLARMDFAPVAFTVEDPALIPEGLAYDPQAQAFYLGSIAEHRIMRIDAQQHITEFAGAAADLDSVLGLAVDSPRHTLYAVSTSALTTKGREHLRNEVVAFDLVTGTLVRRYETPLAAQLNDVTVAFGGRAYVTDSGTGAVFELQEDRPARVLVGPNVLRGSNGIAASADGRKLYVAHATGIAVVDTTSGAWKPLVNRTRENVAAIDGLYQYNGGLIGVENVTNPGRVVLMRLSNAGDEIVEVRTVLSHHHNQLNEPTTGAVRADTGYFYLLAATGVGHFDEQGNITKPDTLPTPTVLKVLLPR